MVTIGTLNGGNITVTLGSGGNSKTRFTLQDGTVEEYDIEGTLNKQWLIDHGYWEGTMSIWLKQIREIELGNTVTTIGESAFDNCENLTSVTIPSSVTSIGTLDNSDYIGAFQSCINLTSLTIEDGIAIIGSYAFYGCGLPSVTIPNSVRSIGNLAFCHN
jgi:hypothetical protein